jgi:acetyltransferase
VEYVSDVRLAEGKYMTLRPVRPEDEDMLIAFHSTLSDDSVRLRYFGPLSLETRTAHRRLVRICFCDYEREIAIVAEHGTGANRKIVAVGRLNRLHDCNKAEFAVVVSDEWQGRSLGTRLLKTLIEIGRAEKFEAIVGTVLQSNPTMLSICKNVGFCLSREADGDTVAVKLVL